MSLKSDKWIKSQCIGQEVPMIEPFFESIKRVDGERKIPSYGLSSYGYDVRLGDEFLFYTTPAHLIDQEEMFTGVPVGYEDADGKPRVDYYFIPKSASVLTRSVVDIADPATQNFTRIKGAKWIDLPPNSFCLSMTMEKINMPRDASVVCMGKSTVARNGIIVIVTPLEAGWSGYVTLEIYNTLPLPVRIYPGMGITQMQFFSHPDEQCETSYDERGGKYMDQACQPVPPRL